MPDFHLKSLRIKILALALVAVLPAVGLVLYKAAQEREEGRREVIADISRLAHLAAVNETQVIEGTRLLLIALSSSPAVIGADNAQCSAQLSGLLAKFNWYANLAVTRPDGRLGCSALPAAHADMGDRGYFKEAMASKAFVIGEYQIGRAARRPDIALAYPVLEPGGNVIAVLIAALGIEAFEKSLHMVQLPDGAVIHILDRNGTVIAQVPGGDQWIGKHIPEALLAQAKLSRGMTGAELPGTDGVERLWAHERVGAGAGALFVGIGILKQRAFIHANRDLAFNLAALALVTIAGLLAAWVPAKNFILNPTRVLMRDIEVRKRSEQRLRQSEAVLAEAQKISHTGSWRWHVGTGDVTWSEEKFRILGYDPKTTQASLQLFLHRVHPEDRPSIEQVMHKSAREKCDFEQEYRIVLADGSIRHVKDVGQAVVNDSGDLVEFIGTTADLTERKRIEDERQKHVALLESERQVLELIATGVELPVVLDTLARLVEAQAEGMLCSILLLDADGCLRHGAAPSLPKEYNDLINGIRIGPKAGSCGAAAFSGKPVYVSDIESDPLWDDYRDSARPHGLRACWSAPILADDGSVLGALAMYYREPRLPEPQDLRLIGMATQMARVAIQEKRSEERLRESEERQKALLDGIPDIAWLKDRDGQYIAVNRPFRLAFGLEDANISGKTDHDFFAPAEAERYRGEDLRVMNTKETSKVEDPIFRDGKKRWIETITAPIKDERDAIAGTVGISRDITERKQIERELRQSEERFRSAMEHAPIGMAIVSLEGLFVQVNRALCTIVGYTREELEKRTFQDITHPEDLEADLAHVRELLNGAVNSYEMDKRYFHKDGHIVWVQLTASVMRSGKGNPMYFIGQIQDISDRKKAEEELAKANRRLQLLSRRLLTIQESERRHIARELHDEIGQALTAVSIGLQTKIKHDRRKSSAKLNECIRIVDQALRKVRNLSLNLRPPQLDDLGLAAAMQWLISSQAAMGGPKYRTNIGSVKSSLDHETEVACFRVCQEALTNVARHAGASEVRIDLTQTNGTLHLTVRDDGKGFDVRNARKLASEGSSIGLVGMEERMALVNGELRVSSVRGKGTEIHAIFPLVSLAVARAKQVNA